MKRSTRAAIVLGVVGAAVLLPAMAMATLSRSTTNPGNAVTAGVLRAPGTLSATAHVSDNAANTGTVTLTWSQQAATGTVAPTGYIVDRQTSGSSTWQSVGTPTAASACSAGTCSYGDTTAAFNTTYSYRVRSTLANWTAGPANVRVAASFAPTAAEERAALNSVAASGSAAVAVGQGGRIMVCPATCSAASSWQAATSPTTNDLNKVVFDAGTPSRAWAVGAAGTVLKCDSGCTATSAAWTSVNAGTTENLYGIYAETGYVGVVGANRTMRYTTSGTWTTWLAGNVNAGASTTTLYAIAAKSSQVAMVVGSGGLIAGCVTNGSHVCGENSSQGRFNNVFSSGGPTVDMRDAAYAQSTSPTADNFYAVGAGGNVYASAAAASGYAKKTVPTTADLYGVTATGATVAVVGDPATSAVFLQCGSSCTGSGTWSAGANTGTTNRLTAIAGTTSAYWAVGPSSTIRYFNGSSWTTHSVPVTASLVQTQDGSRYGLGTAASLGSPCATPALVATATVPARSGSGVTSPTVKVTIGYAFSTSTNASQVSLSTNGGTSWSTARALTSNVSATTAKTVDFTGTVTGSDAAQTIQLCVQGSAGGGLMNVDMVHIDVEE